MLYALWDYMYLHLFYFLANERKLFGCSMAGLYIGSETIGETDAPMTSYL